MLILQYHRVTQQCLCFIITSHWQRERPLVDRTYNNYMLSVALAIQNFYDLKKSSMTYRCADISDSLTSMCYTNPDIRIGWRVLYRYYLWVMTRKQECCLFCSVPYVNVALLWILFLIWNLGTVSALIFHHQPAFSNTPHCWFHYRSRNRGTERGEREREREHRERFKGQL